jgi:phosphate uptake regulator
MKRRVVKHGTSTLTISLPIDWVKKFKIQSGQELDVQEQGSKIVIRQYDNLSNKQVVVKLYEKDNLPKRLISPYYLAGYNTIKICYTHLEIRSALEAFVNNYLMGFEIIEEGQNFIIIKNVAKGIEEEFDVLLNRLGLIAISMLKDIYESFKKKDLSLLQGSELGEMAANKINHFCRRMLNLTGHKTKNVASVYFVIKILEDITDQENFLSKYAIENNINSVSNPTMNYIKSLIYQIELWHKVFIKYNNDFILESKKLEARLTIEGEQLLQTCHKSERIIVYRLLIIQRHLQNIMGDEAIAFLTEEANIGV